MMRFTIEADGHVSAAEVQESELGDHPTEACIGKRMLTWTFPPPKGGGLVVVSYPFVLKVADQ